MTKAVAKKKSALPVAGDYPRLVGGISELLHAVRRASVRTVNAFMTATYWEIGRRIVEFEQRGQERAEYGKELLSRLANNLTARFGRGFSVDNLENMRLFYGVCGAKEISETLSRKLAHASPTATLPISETPSRNLKTTAAPLELTDVAHAYVS